VKSASGDWVKSESWWNLQVGEIWQKWNWVQSDLKSWWNLQQWGRWTWAKIRPSPQVSVGSELSSETGWNLKVGEICKLVKSDKSEIGWNLNVGEFCKLVESATGGTMDLSKNAAEPTGECGLRIVTCRLRIVRWNWVKSASWWNLQVDEIWKWVKWEKEVGENEIYK